MKTMIVGIMTVLALLSGIQEVSSAPVLDQSQTLQDATLGINSSLRLAQTFNGSLTGNLAKISLYFTATDAGGGISSSRTEPITISVLGTTAGAPNETVLWSATFDDLGELPPSSTPGWLDVDTSVASPMLVAGTTYAIALTRVGTTVDRWYVEKDNVYAGGQAYQKIGADPWTTVSLSNGTYTNVDAAFQTFIVPEPTTVGLATLGLMFVLFRSRNRLRKYT